MFHTHKCLSVVRAMLSLLAFALALFPLTTLAEDGGNYRLTANDMLDFRVFQESEMDSVVRLSGDGQAGFPLIGMVQLSGKTIAEATAELQRRYRDGYLVNPQISLTIRQYAKRSFTILGQVQKPGSYEITGNEGIDLLQAVGMAGGYTRIADPGKVTVKRRTNGSERVIKVDAKRMARDDATESFSIRPGDTITIGESIF